MINFISDFAYSCYAAAICLLERREHEKLPHHQLHEHRYREEEKILTLFVAAIAMLSSMGCQLICRIFLLKSI